MSDGLDEVRMAAAASETAAIRLTRAAMAAHAAGVPIAPLARAAGIARITIYRWVKERAPIYDQINQMRRDLVTKAYEAGQLNPDHTLAQHLAAVSDLGEGDWTKDPAYGRMLGNPESDWCVDVVEGDTVRVYAGGDVEASRVIPGAGAL